VRDALRQHLAAALHDCFAAGTLTSGALPDLQLEVPGNPDHGDFATNLAMQLAKSERKAPRQIAEILVAALGDGGGLWRKVEIAGPGFINLRLTAAARQAVVAEVLVRLGLTEQALARLTRIDIRQPLPAGHLLDLELAWRMLGRPVEAELLSRATLAAASRPWPSWLAEHRARVLMINGRAAEGLALLESSTPAGYDFGSGGPALDGQLLRIRALRQAGQDAQYQRTRQSQQ